ncbi:MAG: sulfate adenylyltransferase subunit CysD [Hyphomicrobiales bacterium]
MDHLDNLESEAIEILREVQATAARPVMLYSIGKDSSVMLRLAQKAFFPGPIPFPLLHINTGWKFPEMIEFRDRMAREVGFKLITYINPRGKLENIGPFSHGSSYHTDVMKTEALKLALDTYGFDVAFGGARRDEEKSRAKERIFSFRGAGHRWDPKAQRPELWSLYNGQIRPGESIRIFPISNWTESDIWSYIKKESIPIVPLYFSAERPVVRRNGQWIMMADERMKLEPDEMIQKRRVRFRTLGCYPLTAAVESDATTLDEIVMETLSATTSERQGRIIDNDGAGSMERKKQEGYF